MRIDLVAKYLVGAFFYRLRMFFVHWYQGTFFVFRSWASQFKKQIAIYWLVVGFLFLIYIVWALIPIYLVIRIFYEPTT